MTMKKIIIFGALALVGVMAIGCGDGTSSTSTSAPQGSKIPGGGPGGDGGKAVAPEN